MAYKGYLKDKNGDVIYPITSGDCIQGGVPTPIEEVRDVSGVRTVYPSKVYRFTEPIGELTLDIDGNDVVAELAVALEVYLTTGDAPALTIQSERGMGVRYYEGFSIEPNKSYELNIMWNGHQWIVAGAEISGS